MHLDKKNYFDPFKTIIVPSNNAVGNVQYLKQIRGPRDSMRLEK
jgi:hypothetical protein